LVTQRLQWIHIWIGVVLSAETGVKLGSPPITFSELVTISYEIYNLSHWCNLKQS